MTSRLLPNFTSERAVHSQKAPLSISVTLSGMTTAVSFEHSLKAPLLMTKMPLPMDNSVRFVQALKEKELYAITGLRK